MVFANSVNNPYTLNDLIFIPIKPLMIYWYLYYLVLYYLIFYWIDNIKINERYKFSIIFILSVISSFLNFNIISPLDGIIKYSIFFYLGIVMSKYGFNVEFVKSQKIITITITALAIILIIISCIINVNLFSISGVGIIFAIIISFGIINIFAGTGCKNKVLVFVGSYSLEIYVMHVFIIAANRKILPAAGITNFYANAIVNFLMAVFIPIGCAFLLKKMNLHKLIFRPANYFADKKL